MKANTAQYEFGEIPDQRLWVGESNQLTFQVTTQTLAPDTELSVLVVGDNLAGQITLDPATRVFTYVPHAEDINPFEVIFKAVSGSNGTTETREQRVQITPLPRLPAERHIVDDSCTPPERRLYTKLTEADWKQMIFNGQVDRQTKTLVVQGITVVYDPGSPDHSFVGYEDRDDLYSVDIRADVLIIRQPMGLPGTNVTISAREMHVESNGSINTTPKAFAVPAAPGSRDDARPGADGHDGQVAGDITLAIASFHAPVAERPCFILNGGKGQAAGEGEDGVDHGTEQMEYKPEWIDDTPGLWEIDGKWKDKWKSGPGDPIVYVRKKVDRSVIDIFHKDYSEDWGQNSWPDSGRDAAPPGRPGNGGNGGNFKCSLDEESLPDTLVSVLPGEAGGPARDAHGGKHGGPYPCRWLEYTVKEGLSDKPGQHLVPVWKLDTDTVKWTPCDPLRNGKDEPAPTALAGQRGSIERDFSSSGSNWLLDSVLTDVVRFIKDAYLANNRDLVRQYLELYGDATSALFAAATPRQKAVQIELVAMRNRLENRLDYFGNPAGWTPLLSVQANLRAYDNEIDRAMQALFLAYWVDSVSTDKAKAVKGLEASIANLEQDIEAATNQVKDLQDTMPDLQGMVDSLNSSLANTHNRLANLTNRLTDEARKAVEKRHQERFLVEFGASMLGGLTAVIPFGQPALGAAGQIGSSLITSQYQTPEETRSEIMSALKSAASAQLKSKTDDIVNAANPQNTQKRIDAKARAGGLTQVASALGPAITGITNAFQQLGAPQDEIEAELARLAAENPKYQSMTREIADLNSRKADFSYQLAVATQTITAGYNRITANALAIDSFADEIASQKSDLDPTALQHVEDMRRRALEVLQRYQYFLIKSYQATWLKPYKGASLQLDLVFKKIEDLLDSSEDGSLPPEQFNALRAIFTDIMDEMVRRLLEDLRPEYETTQWLTLSYEDTPQVMQQLNNEGEVRINLMDLGLLLPNYENVRLADISVESNGGIVLAHDRADPQGTLHLDFTLSGDGTIRSDGKLFVVRHPTSSGLGYDAQSQLRWGVTYDVKREHLERTKPSTAFVSLLRYMLKDESQANVNDDQFHLLSQPAAWTDIIISKHVTNSPGPIDLTELTLQIRLTYLSAPRNQCVLNVTTRNGHKPLIQCSPRDRNQRDHGYGSLYRIFSRHTQATLSAPLQYGRLTFSHWQVFHTDTLHREEIFTPIHTLEMDDHFTVVCVYSDGSLPQRPRLAIGKRGRVKPGKGNNLREAPSLEGARIGGIPAGGEFEVVGGPVDSLRYVWWQVNYKGQVGWTAEGLDGEYWLETVGDDGSSSGSQLVTGGRGRVKVDSGLNVRDRASASGQKLGSLAQGSEFTILAGPVDQDGYTWWKIAHEDLTGWIAAGKKGGSSWIDSV
jgi:predicted  nucleic acid-binding Zn-ribbon protein